MKAFVFVALCGHGLWHKQSHFMSHDYNLIEQVATLFEFRNTIGNIFAHGFVTWQFLMGTGFGSLGASRVYSEDRFEHGRGYSQDHSG